MKKILAPVGAPKAVGPYSQGVVCGDLVFLAGQIPLDPATGRLVEGTIEDHTRRVLENVTALLESAGLTRRHAVKATVFLADLADFASMNKVYAEYFGENPPARSTIQVAALPLGARIEIEIVAHRGAA